MLLFDAKTLRLLAANPSATTTYGYSQEQLLAMTVKNVIANSDRKKFEDCLAAMTTTQHHRGHCRHVAKDGRTIHVDMTWYEMDFDGHRAHMVIAVDITARVSAEQAVERYVRELETALQSAVNVIDAIVEVKDTYTADHSNRVGRLAEAISAEMGLDEETQASMRVMGLLHDAGKIGIPSDLLTKGKALTGPEYELVKTHPQIGYDIVRRFNFRWPVAEVILQHHERMDGSGYPSGLKGEEIRLESRIIAAADVIDAMTSHRPYRTGLSSGVAWDEILSGSGTRYDSQVAQACARLIENGAWGAN